MKITDILLVGGVIVGAYIGYKLFTGQMLLPPDHGDPIAAQDEKDALAQGRGDDAYEGRITLSS